MNNGLQERALKELRTTKEWHDLEAEDITKCSPWPMRHMCAGEVLEHHNKKIQQCYKAEAWHREQMAKCDSKIAELNAWPSQSKAKTNRLQHWTGRRLEADLAIKQYVDAGHRHERLINKWRGICDVILQADTAKEIAAEKQGNGNKYGFNPNMQSRATATDIFED